MAAYGQIMQQLPYTQNQMYYPNYPGNVPPWPPQLSNKAIGSMWATGKQLHPHEEEEVGFYELMYLIKRHLRLIYSI